MYNNNGAKSETKKIWKFQSSQLILESGGQSTQTQSEQKSIEENNNESIEYINEVK